MSETLLNINQNNINTQDASFTEMIKATQVGKKELAQALIDKGADVTANSTLVEMADATKNLVLQDGCEWIVTKGGVASETGMSIFGDGSSSIWSKLTILFYEDMKNLIFYNGTFYFVENGTYENVDDMMTNSSGTHIFQDWIDTYSANNSPTIVKSKDGTKIAVNVDTNVFYVFSVDWTNHTMTEITHFTTSNQDGNVYWRSSFAINDNATVLAYHNSYNGGSGEYAVFFWSITKGEQYRYNPGDNYEVPAVFIENNKLITAHGSSSYNDRNLYIINFNIAEDGTLSNFNTTGTNFGADENNQEIRASYNFEIGKFIGVSRYFPNQIGKDNYFNLFIIDLTNGTRCNKKIKILCKNTVSSTSAFVIDSNRIQSYAISYYATYFRLFNLGNGKYKFIDPLLEQINVVYDSINNKITSDYDYFLPSYTSDEYSTGGYNSGTRWRTICKNSDGKYLEAAIRYGILGTYPTFKYNDYAYTRLITINNKEYKLALKVKNNGNEFLISGLNITDSNLDNYYTKDTTKVEL